MDHVLFRMMEYGMTHQYFTLADLREKIGEDWNQAYFHAISRSSQSPNNQTIFFIFEKGEDRLGNLRYRPIDNYSQSNAVFVISPEAASRYLEMTELIEARKAAKQARSWAIFSIIIAILALVIPFVTVQEVRVINNNESEQGVGDTEVKAQQQKPKSEIRFKNNPTPKVLPPQ